MLRGRSVIFLVHHIPSSPRTVYNLQALPQGASYGGPIAGDGNNCKCSTVVYSLLSACDSCQGDSWITYVSHPSLAFCAYLLLVGLIMRPTAQVVILPQRESTVVVRGFLALTENILPVSLILFPPEHACPIGRSLMSQFVTHLSSSLHNDRISQVKKATWNSSQAFDVGGRNTLLSPSLNHLQSVRSLFQILPKYQPAG